jgi:hypothetical protein
MPNRASFHHFIRFARVLATAFSYFFFDIATTDSFAEIFPNNFARDGRGPHRRILHRRPAAARLNPPRGNGCAIRQQHSFRHDGIPVWAVLSGRASL